MIDSKNWISLNFSRGTIAQMTEDFCQFDSLFSLRGMRPLKSNQFFRESFTLSIEDH